MLALSDSLSLSPPAIRLTHTLLNHQSHLWTRRHQRPACYASRISIHHMSTDFPCLTLSYPSSQISLHLSAFHYLPSSIILTRLLALSKALARRKESITSSYLPQPCPTQPTYLLLPCPLTPRIEISGPMQGLPLRVSSIQICACSIME